jgi:hypothetical protein
MTLGEVFIRLGLSLVPRLDVDPSILCIHHQRSLVLQIIEMHSPKSRGEQCGGLSLRWGCSSALSKDLSRKGLSSRTEVKSGSGALSFYRYFRPSSVAFMNDAPPYLVRVFILGFHGSPVWNSIGMEFFPLGPRRSLSHWLSGRYLLLH